MEIEEKNLIKKIRSSQACIKDGYQLYTANFRRIFRHTWALAIIFALITATASALPVLVSPTLVLPAFLLEVDTPFGHGYTCWNSLSAHRLGTDTFYSSAHHHYDGC